jgi:hypothetical protein
MSHYTRELYKRGEEICKFWADQNKVGSFSRSVRNDLDDKSIVYDNISDYSTESDTYATIETRSLVGKKSIQFNSSTYDCLRQTIVLKVSSHQWNDDFSPNDIRKSPCPNMFIASANQIADNAATKAQRAH